MPCALNLDMLTSLPEAVATPAYDRSHLAPGILHVGIGNFHRAHMAVYLDRLFGLGEGLDWAIIGAGVRPADGAMREKLAVQDWLTTVIELDPSGLSAQVTGSMVDFLPVDPDAIVAAMADPRIRIVSLTVTEGGYYIDAATGKLDTAHPDIKADAASPDAPRTVFGMILKALRRRRASGIIPFTVMSCDNLPGNGHVAQQTVAGLAQLFDQDLAHWVETEIAFPNSMVDCITPATTDRERALVRERFGIADDAPVICEPFRQWVIEDHFPAGRPPLEKVGAEFVADVTRHELMKLRILNAGHASIAYASGLLGHHFVHDAMADPDIRNWLVALENREIIPTLAPIEGVDYARYLDTIVTRFANPEIGDTIPRLALEGSDRQPKFVLPAIRDALADGKPVDGLALEVALWCRYCLGKTEDGGPISVKDSQAEELLRRAAAASERPAAFLENTTVFGDMGQDPRFAASFEGWLGRLRDQGVRGTLQAYASRG
jgi:mannitol 2-dehydrogenase